MDNQNTNTLSNDQSRGVSNVNSSNSTTVPFDELNAVPTSSNYNEIQPESNLSESSEGTTPTTVDISSFPNNLVGNLQPESIPTQQPTSSSVPLDMPMNTPSPVSEGSNLEMNSVPTPTPTVQDGTVNMPSEGMNFNSTVPPVVDTPTVTPDFAQEPATQSTDTPSVQNPLVEQTVTTQQSTEDPLVQTPLVEQATITQDPVVQQTETPFPDPLLVDQTLSTQNPTTDTPVVSQNSAMELIPPTPASFNPSLPNSQGSEIVNTLEEVNKEGKESTILIIALVVIIVVLIGAILYFGSKILF